MYRLFGELYAYDVFNDIAIIVLAISSLFMFKIKRNHMSLLAKKAIYCFSQKDDGAISKIKEIIIVSIESVLIAAMLALATLANRSFGNMMGTAANYFATLFLAPVLFTIISLIIVANPIEQMDIYTPLAPLFLFFVKLACFFNGCCWGIPWEKGLYNHHPTHPGYQVPIQIFEAFCALAIFIFLIRYRQKAKPGTMYPLYMILYSATRFPIEFLSGGSPKVIGQFNPYHFLCIAGIVIGLLMLLFVKFFGGRLYAFFEKPHEKFEAKVSTVNLKKELDEETERLARLQKAKLARAKAKARNKTKTRKK